MVSIEARTERERMVAARRSDVPLEESRRNWEAGARNIALPDGTRVASVTAGGVACDIVEAPGATAERVLLFFHGGGYVSGSPRTHRGLAAELGRVTGMRVLLPDYRLAPEQPFPAGVKDALLVYQWLLNEGFAEDRIVVGGDSAGGGLALTMLLALRAAGARMPRAALLLSPWTDLTCSSPSYAERQALDPVITSGDLRQTGLLYAGSRDPADPLLSPLFADLRGLPPLLIQVAGDEVMLDDSLRLAEAAERAGVPVRLRRYDGMWHVFHLAGIEIPEVRQALSDIAEDFGRLYGAPSAD